MSAGLAEPGNWSFISRNGAFGRPLYPWGPGATYRTRFDEAGLPTGKRVDLYSSIYDSQVGSVSHLVRGRAAVLMAGPPGAGKSSSRHELTRRLGWRAGTFYVIDPDEIKKDLLKADLAAGTFGSFVPSSIQREIDAGTTITPMELVGLWHEESVRLSNLIVQRALHEGLNVIIDGTLANADRARELFAWLQKNAYADITIADVEASRADSLRGVRDRYRKEMKEPLGGRVVPDSTIRHHFSGPGGMSLSLLNSDALYRDRGNKVRLIAFRRGDKPNAPRVVFDTSSRSRGDTYVPAAPSGSEVWVSSHWRNGTFVQEHWRSRPARS